MKPYRREPNGPYWYKFMFRGALIRQSSGVYNKQDCIDIAAAHRTKLVKGEIGLTEPEPPPVIPTFSAAMKDFLDWSEQEYSAHPATHRRYVTSSKALLNYFKSTPLERIDAAAVEKFKAQRARHRKLPQGKKSSTRSRVTKKIRPATVNRELALLGHLFSHNDALVPINPCRKVKRLDEDNEQFRVLTSEEEKLYLMAASQPLQDIAVIMVETGMRPEEVYRIRRENVHLDKGYLFNPHGKTKSARRRLWLTEKQSRSIAILEKRLRTIKGEYLFPGRVEGKAICKVNAAHTATVKRANVASFRLYDLRHTFATRAVESGVDLVTLAAMLGHSKINMVLRYAHPTQEHQQAAMLKMQAAR